MYDCGSTDWDGNGCRLNGNEEGTIVDSSFPGMHYQWAAVMDWDGEGDTPEEGTQGLCPSGWHIPTDDEWKELEMELGMSQIEADAEGHRGTNEGDKLKDVEADWCDSSTDCGISGFNALPTGYRGALGSLFVVGWIGDWWSSSSDDSSAWRRFMSKYSVKASVGRDTGSSWTYGYSVRCVLGQ